MHNKWADMDSKGQKFGTKVDSLLTRHNAKTLKLRLSQAVVEKYGGIARSHKLIIRDAQIVRLYLVGRRFPEIAQEVGLSLRAVQASYARSLKRGIVPIHETNEMRKEALGRLDIMRRRMFEDLESATTIEQRGLVIDPLVKIETRQATMLGLDVPQRLAVALYPDNTPNDDVTVEELKQNLTLEELTQLNALMIKARGGKSAVEVSATTLH